MNKSFTIQKIYSKVLSTSCAIIIMISKLSKIMTMKNWISQEFNMNFPWNFLNYTSKNRSVLVEVAFKKVEILTKLCIVEDDQKNVFHLLFSSPIAIASTTEVPFWNYLLFLYWEYQDFLKCLEIAQITKNMENPIDIFQIIRRHI